MSWKQIAKRKHPNPAKTFLLPRGIPPIFGLLGMLGTEPQFPEPCWVCHDCKGILQASVDTGDMSCPQCRKPMQWYGPPRKFAAPDGAIDVQAEDVTDV